MKPYLKNAPVVLLLVSGLANADPGTEQKSKTFFRRYDANHDGVLSKQEFPQRNARMFDRIDANGDGSITLEEDIAFRNKQQERTTRSLQGKKNKQQADPEGTTILRDVVYASPGGSDQMLDIYLPPNPEMIPLPVVVWIHGGGWKSGTKGNPDRVRGMLHDGFAVVDINYRLSGEAIFPAQVMDCKAAIRWIRANASTYHFHPDRIGVSGSSAGGHLVAFLGTTGHTREYDVGENLDYSSAVQAVCDWFGPTDIMCLDEQAVPGSMLKHNAPDSPESKLVGGPITEEPYRTTAKKVNPITYITGKEPPFLILHGDADKTVSPQQSELLHAALKKAGDDSTLYIVKGGQHGLRGGSGEERDEALEKMVADFFKTHLRKNS